MLQYHLFNNFINLNTANTICGTDQTAGVVTWLPESFKGGNQGIGNWELGFG